MFYCLSLLTGITLEDRQHREYVDEFCDKFEENCKDMIVAGVHKEQMSEINDPIYSEVVQHIKFAKSKCETFLGREDILKVRVRLSQCL